MDHHVHLQALTPRAAWHAHPCRCSARHQPAGVPWTDGHHVFPQAFQLDLWEEIRDMTLVYLCPNAHRLVHYYLGLLLAGKALPPRPNRYLRGIAQDGVAHIRAAYAAAGQPIPGVPVAPPGPE